MFQRGARLIDRPQSFNQFIAKPHTSLTSCLQSAAGNAKFRTTMALPLPPGLTPSEIGFLCEMELVTVIPRQRLDALELLGVSSSRPA